MDMTVYEAASYYDYFMHMRQSGVFPSFILLLNADNGGVAICQSHSDGKISLCWKCEAELGVRGKEAFLNRLCEKVKLPQDDIWEMIKEQLPIVNKRMKNYFRSGSKVDTDALADTEGRGLICCSGLAEAFQEEDGSIRDILKKALKVLEEKNISELDIRIIIFGDFAEFYPVQYVVRSILSYDPFLPDERYMVRGKEEMAYDIVSRGMELHRANHVTQHDIILLVDHMADEDALQEVEQVVLSQKNEPLDELQHPFFCLPIFISKEDQLQFLVDGKMSCLPVPFDLGADGFGLVEAGCIAENDQIMACIRRFAASGKAGEEKIYKLGFGIDGSAGGKL